MTEIVPGLGVLAGAIGVADTIPYVRDILRGSTRPHRGTWLIVEGSTNELTAAFRGCKSEAGGDRAPAHYTSSSEAGVS